MRDQPFLTAHWRRPVVVLVCSVAVLTVTWWQMSERAVAASRNRVGDTLDTVLQKAHMRLHAWADEEQATVRLWAESPDVVRLAEELLQVERTAETLLASPTQTELRRLLRPVLDTRGYRGFFVIARDYCSLASTRDCNIGTPNILGEDDVLERVWRGQTIVTVPQPSDVELIGEDGLYHDDYPTMFAASPIRRDDGTVFAALTFRIDPFRGFGSILQECCIGRSGETYAFNRNGVMISESRFDSKLRQVRLLRNDQSSLLNIRVCDPGINLTTTSGTVIRDDCPLTVMALSATAGRSGRNLQGYPDYRGVPVVGVWMWKDELQMGLTTQIDLSEASEELQATQQAVSGLALLSVVLMVGLTFVPSDTRGTHVRNHSAEGSVQREPKASASLSAADTCGCPAGLNTEEELEHV